MTELPTNPHDQFFKLVFGRTETSREFFVQHLPPAVAARIDLGTLQPTRESFVDAQLRTSCSDLLFTASMAGGGEALVYLLFEHKSRPDRLMPLQLLRYVVRILEQQMRQGRPPCVVIPVVLYHGSSAWTVATTMDELVDAPVELRHYVPRFSLELVDLSQYGDDKLLRGQVILRTARLLLKYSRTPDLRDRLPGIAQLLSDVLNEPDGVACVAAMLRYLAATSDKIAPEELLRVVTSHMSDVGRELMPTVAEQWIQQGFDKGVEQGVEQGRAEGMAEGLQRGELLGRIRMLEELLGREPSALETLRTLTLEQLTQQAESLRSELTK